MQNKSAIWVFTILLAIASLYQISFTFITAGVEGDSEEYAQMKVDSIEQAAEGEIDQSEREKTFQKYEQAYLQKMNNEEVYPLLGFTYKYCKKNEINLGLDLQGGMNVTLQVSVEEMINALSDKSSDENFQQALRMAREKQSSSTDDFVTLFEESWNEINPNGSLAAVFHTRENKDKFPADATNEDILSVIREEANAAVSRTEQVLRRRIDNLGVVQPSIQRQPGTGRIVVELPGVKEKERVRKILQGTAKLEFWEAYDNSEIYPGLEKANTALAERLGARDKKEDKTASSESDVVEETPEGEPAAEGGDVAMEEQAEEGSLDAALGNNVDKNDTLDSNSIDPAEDIAQSQEDFAKENPLFAVLKPSIYQDPETGGYFSGKGPTVGYASISDTGKVNEYLQSRDVKSSFPRNAKFLWASKPYDDEGKFLQLFAVKVPGKDGIALLEGDKVTNARVVSDPLGNPEISLSMNSEGAKIWKRMTGDAAGQTPKKSIAIVLDDLVYTAPRVDGEIAGGQSSISGSFTVEEADDLANVLKAGKLPAPAKIIEEAVVGPTLGQEAINAGFMSFLLALVIVLAYMAFYYSSAGIIADIALVSNLFFIMGVLSSLGATLTLPGIAGIVLTIGMSVDANVLIYERIREELRAGKGVRLAIVDGYKNAYSSIIDANITTLLTGIILYIFGSGPIKGFATTLIIGIATSLFAAIFITRLLFEWRLESNAKPAFSTRLTENLMTKMNIQFVAKRKMYYMISGAVIILGIVSLGVRGLNFGVDFTGGRSYIVRFDQSQPVEEISKTLGASFVSAEGLPMPPEVKTYGSSNQVKITTSYLIFDKSDGVEEVVEGALESGLAQISPNYEIMSSQKVGPTIADDIKQASIWSVLFSLIVIFLYILIRFRKWQFGLGALAAMFHDVLIVISLFSILYGFLPFSLEIDQAFIAAILTVVGYSINDTVVVFDRIREYVGLHKRKEYKGVINDALNSTLSRTLNTSLSTLIVLLMIFFFGGEVIRGFVFALIIGVIVGTYSSLFVASPIVVDLAKKEK